MSNTGEALQGIRLRYDETCIHQEDYEPLERTKPMSSLLGMMALTGVTKSSDIGKNGPSIASRMVRSEKDGRENNQGLFDVYFGRDAHIVARFLAPMYPELAKATVKKTFETMGTKDNYINPVYPYDQQQIGKAVHEYRDPTDPHAVRLTEEFDWGWPYYGAVDTTSKNIITTGLILDIEKNSSFLDETYIDRDGNEHSNLYGLEQNIDWLCSRMDLNTEGLVESLWDNFKHHPNQTWADSPEAFYHADGSWAEHHPEKGYGVAAVEQQAEAYDALLIGAQVAEQQGDIHKASTLRTRAARLQRVVLDIFWVADETKFGGFFAQGTDRDGEGNLRPLAVRSSDMGNMLNSNILMPTGDPVLDKELAFKRDAIVDNLFSPEMLCPSGIRTKSTDSARYDDHRYHGGTSWNWVTVFIADGLEKHGKSEEAKILKCCVLDTVNTTMMLGEYNSGSADPTQRIVNRTVKVRSSTNMFEGGEYTISQPAQELQAWTAAAVLKIKHENNPFKKKTMLY